jgi:ABC-type transport system involved in multi-copper enzyme maturation permease subunit
MNIVRLVTKDLRLQRGFLAPLAGLQATCIFLLWLQLRGETRGLLFPLANGVALIADFLVCYRTITAEEKNRALIFLQTLPISRWEIVAAKFGVNLLLVTGNFAVLLGLLLGSRVWSLFAGELLPGPITVATVLLVHWLINAFFVAIALIFDSERAVWVPFPALFLAISAVLNARSIVSRLGLEAAATSALRRGELIPFALLFLHSIVFLTTLRVVGRKKTFG